MRQFRFMRDIRLGIKNLMLHKLRSLLTMLGVVFGVGSVVAMLAVGEGASAQALEQIRKLGEIRAVMPDTDMLEHADRNDPVKAARLVAKVAQIKADPVIQPVAPRLFGCIFLLVHRQRDPGHRRVGRLSKIRPQTTPA